MEHRSPERPRDLCEDVHSSAQIINERIHYSNNISIDFSPYARSCMNTLTSIGAAAAYILNALTCHYLRVLVGVAV